MAIILSISSQVVFGPVGNSASVPPLQHMGHEVMQLPTVLLSNHPGHGKPEGMAIEPKVFARILDKTLSLCNAAALNAVATGYFASVEQVKSAAAAIRTLKSQNGALVVLVDPVFGDHGKLYVQQEIAEAIRDQLLPLASITTPNLFELSWLTGEKAKARPAIATIARELGIREVIVTSVPAVQNELETVLVTDEYAYAIAIEKRKAIANGTGDFLAGAYLAHRLLMPANTAFQKSMRMLRRVIERSDGSDVLAIAPALKK